MKKHSWIILMLLIFLVFLSYCKKSRSNDPENPDDQTNNQFIEHIIERNFSGAIHVYAEDLDGDGDVDVVGAAFHGDEIAWWENDGNQNFTMHSIITNYDGARVVFVIDVDGDGDNDLVGAAVYGNKITWWENDGGQSFIEHSISENFPGANFVYAKDIDEDGDTDVLGATWDFDEGHNDSIAWWENNGNQDFIEHTISANHDRNSCLFPIDIDSDGDEDILCAVYGDGAITCLENDGNQNFTEYIISNYINAHWVYATDMDSDGDIDIIGSSISGMILSTSASSHTSKR